MTDRVPDWVDPELYPFTGAWIDAAGHHIHYLDEGSGPTLLMVHGNPTWSFVYRDVITALRNDFRCVAIDLPGFGLSTAAEDFDFLPASHAEVVGKFVTALDLTDVIVVVQDWGGPIGLHALSRLSERWAGAVIGNTWAWPVNGNRHFEMFSAAMGGPVGAFAIRHLNTFVNVMIPMGHKRRRLTNTEMRHYRKPMATSQRRQATAVFPRQIIKSRDFLADVESSLPHLATLPSLIVWGDGDIAFREPELQRWHTALPDAETVVLAGCGHFLQSDAPDEFAAAIRDWYPRAVKRT